MDLVSEVLTFSRDFVNGNQTVERKQKIAAAYKNLFGENMKIGCGTCYIESIFLIIKRMNLKPCKYRLMPGCLRRPVFGDASKEFTNKNITDELAELDLMNNPGAIKYYTVYPNPLPWLIPDSVPLEIVPPVKAKMEVKTVFEPLPDVSQYAKVSEVKKESVPVKTLKEPKVKKVRKTQ